ncbi:amino acid permease [soil metagenome]
MVGTGVFTSLGFQLKDIPSGFPIMMLWAIGGVVSLCGAFCYAELVAMMPRSGGEYHLLSRVYHPMVGFLAGWVSLIAGFAAPIAAAALLFGSYAHQLWPGLHEQAVAIGLVLLVTLVQLGHLKLVEGFQLAFTILKVLLILIFILGACWFGAGQWHLLIPKAGDSVHFLTEPYAVSLVYVMYAYAGWNGAVYMAGDLKDPQRNLPRALLFGTLIVMMLYLALNAVFLVSAPWEAMQDKPQVAFVAAQAIFGDRGGEAMGLLIALGLIAHLSVLIYAGTSVLRVMGQDVKSLHWLDKPNAKGAPWISVVMLMTLVLVLMLSGTFNQLLLYIQGLLLVSSLLCIAAVPLLRWRKPDAPRPFKVPLYPLPPLVFMGVALWMLVALVRERPVESAWGAVTLLVGAGVYKMSGKKGIPTP